MAPRFTVAVPAYNCARYLADTLRSVLEQDFPSDQLQIVVVDDGSTDDPESACRSLASSRIEFHRQANQGLVKTFNTCVRLARGELIHLLHGDDRVRPGFYAHVDRTYREHPEVGMFTGRCREIDGDGRFLRDSYLPPPRASQVVRGYETLIVPRNHIRTPGVVLRREVYAEAGGYDPRISHTADWNMWLRAAQWGPVWHEVEPLAEYRIHAGSDTNKKAQSGEYLLETWLSVAIWARGLPAGGGLRYLDIINRAVVRMAVNDLATNQFSTDRRQKIEALFQAHLPHLAEPLRGAISRRAFFSGAIPTLPAPRRVVIFGAGEAGRRAFAGLDATRNDVIAFLDNNAAAQGTVVQGKPVLAPAQILHLDYDYILLASAFHPQMHEQLRHLGVDARDMDIWKG
jgi:hypothetical protein